jgi:hypothetical protein
VSASSLIAARIATTKAKKQKPPNTVAAPIKPPSAKPIACSVNKTQAAMMPITLGCIYITVFRLEFIRCELVKFLRDWAKFLDDFAKVDASAQNFFSALLVSPSLRI